MPELTPTLNQLKKKYGKLYSTNIRNTQYIFRALTFSEYDEFATSESSSVDAEEEVLKIALLRPVDFDPDKVPPGIITSLNNEILEISGFGSPASAKAIMDEKRYQAGQIRNIMKAFIIAAMPTYSPQDLDDYSFDQMAELVALAEKIIEIHKAVASAEVESVQLNIVDPEEERERDRLEQEKELQRVLKDPYGDKSNDTKVVGSKFGTATTDDPIAQKLRQALGR